MTALAARSQNDRVLRALRRGPVSLADFLPPTSDGGPTIARLGARIHNLRARGHVIDSRERDEHGCAVYRLVRDAEQTSDSRPLASGDEHSAHAAMVSGENPGRGCRSPVETAACALTIFDAPDSRVESGSIPQAPTAGPPHSSGDPVETFNRPQPRHDPLDHAHRRVCDRCDERYADLAADAAEDEGA